MAVTGYQKIIETMKNGGLVHENGDIVSYLEESTYDKILKICKKNINDDDLCKT